VLSKRKRDNHFSEEVWSSAGDRYRLSVNGLSQDSWDLIIDGAWHVAQEKMSGRAASNRLSSTQMPEIDERELLFEAEHTENVEDDENQDWDSVVVETCKFYGIWLLFTNIVYHLGVYVVKRVRWHVMPRV
jgi:hypothetical protein